MELSEEIERTFLAKEIPSDIESYPSKEIIDIYVPESSDHPTLRIRKNGDKYEITKKEPVKDDPSHQHEHTIPLKEEEFNSLIQSPGKKVHKKRYFYPYNGKELEIDVFQGELKGLVLVDAEFEQHDEKDEFEMPSFCFKDVTQEKLIAGGMLCGKSYEDIQEELESLGYKKL